MGLFTNIVRDYFIVIGSSGICPEQNNREPALIACEYGPMAAGAFGVFISCLSLMSGSMLQPGF